MDCSLGCTPLSIDDWESYEEARAEKELEERDFVEYIPLSDCFHTTEIFLEGKEDLCQE